MIITPNGIEITEQDQVAAQNVLDFLDALAHEGKQLNQTARMLLIAVAIGTERDNVMKNLRYILKPVHPPSILKKEGVKGQWVSLEDYENLKQSWERIWHWAHDPIVRKMKIENTEIPK